MTNRLNLSLLYAVQDKNFEDVECLLRQGANVNTKINGISPLLLASGFNEIEICRALLMYGADPNMSPNGEVTPLITAASFGHCEIVRLLVEAGGDPEVKDVEGLNAHYWAYKSKCRKCSNYLMELRRNYDGFKQVHFSESLGDTTVSSISSKISSLSEDHSKQPHPPLTLKPVDQNTYYSPNSTIKSPIRCNLSSSDIARLKSILGITDKSPNKTASARRPVSPWLSPQNGDLFKSKRLSSSTGNLSNRLNSNQFSRLILHPSTSPSISSQKLKKNDSIRSQNALSGLPPKSPRFGPGRTNSPHRSPLISSGQTFTDTRDINSSQMKNLLLTPTKLLRDDLYTSQISSSEPVLTSTPCRTDFELTDEPASDSKQDNHSNSNGYLWHKVKSYFSGIPLISSQSLPKADNTDAGSYNAEQSVVHSPFDSYSLLSSDDERSDSYRSSDDPATIQVTPVSSSVELDTAFRKSSSESRLSDRRLVDDDDDLIFSGTLDKAFCETEVNLRPVEDVIHIPGDPITDWSFEEILSDVERMKDVELRSKLLTFKVNPGPILKSTRRTYQLKLAKLITLKRSGACVVAKDVCFEPSLEIIHICSDTLDRSILDNLESDMSRPFINPDPMAKWRQGTKKNCFNYVLLDPRISKDLPKRVKIIGQKKGFLIFVESIFYIGKGQKTRPYEHFKEASIHGSKFIIKTTSKKVARILEIWKAGLGVVSLCAFQNAIPVESLTREACMIEAIGIDNLTNVCRGQIYGPASNWSKRDTRRLGSWLLWKSFMILLNEGERQITFKDVNDSGIS